MIDLIVNGVGSIDTALLIERVAVGTFFAASGFNKLMDKERHQALVETLKKDKVPAIGFNQWWVPGWELVGGLMLITGLLAPFAAGVLMIICLVACFAEAKERVAAYKPINKADVVADYLYLPEVLYIGMLLVPVILGAGVYSLDAVLF